MVARAPRIGASPGAAGEYSSVKRTFLGLTGAAAILLIIAQALPLYATHVPVFRASVASRTVGADEAYGVVPIALLALGLGWLCWRGAARRWVLLLIALLGLACLGITLGRGLVDARASGLRLVAGHYVTAQNTVSAGLYAELLGALLLFGAVAVGLLFGEPMFGPLPTRSRSMADRPVPQTPE